MPGTEFEHSYRTQLCGDQWFSADGDEAGEVRLWDGDTVLAVVVYVSADPHARGTYTITEHNLGTGRELTKAEADGWRDWRAALEFAAGTDREEWDLD
jgi:hypothetical protein